MNDFAGNILLSGAPQPLKGWEPLVQKKVYAGKMAAIPTIINTWAWVQNRVTQCPILNEVTIKMFKQNY